MPPGTSLAMRLHLLLCRACCKYRRTYRATTRLTQAAKVAGESSSHVPLNDALVEEIVQRARREE